MRRPPPRWLSMICFTAVIGPAYLLIQPWFGFLLSLAAIAIGAHAAVIGRSDPLNLRWVTEAYLAFLLIGFALAGRMTRREFARHGAWPIKESFPGLWREAFSEQQRGD